MHASDRFMHLPGLCSDPRNVDSCVSFAPYHIHTYPTAVTAAAAAAAGLFPAPIFGPLLGILGVYVADRGDLSDVRRKLFSKGGRGQFKSG
jgi:hypothetical protein